MKYLVLVFALVISGCATAKPAPLPPLPPRQIFDNVRVVVKTLDLLRDSAISANAQTPQVISDATARRIVQFHRDVMTTIVTAEEARLNPMGWAAGLRASSATLVASFSESERRVFASYFSVLITALAGVEGEDR